MKKKKVEKREKRREIRERDICSYLLERQASPLLSGPLESAFDKEATTAVVLDVLGLILLCWWHAWYEQEEGETGAPNIEGFVARRGRTNVMM